MKRLFKSAAFNGTTLVELLHTRIVVTLNLHAKKWNGVKHEDRQGDRELW